MPVLGVADSTIILFNELDKEKRIRSEFLIRLTTVLNLYKQVDTAALGR